MEPQEFAALSKDEMVRLLLRCQVIVSAIQTYMQTTSETKETYHEFHGQNGAVYQQINAQDMAALSKDELEQLVLRCQDIIRRSPIKPGCRFFEALFTSSSW